MTSVFISYSQADSEIASRVQGALKDISISGWLDQADIAAGDSISSKVKESLKQANALIVLVSPSSLANKWVQFEVGAAFGMGKPIIPVIIDSQSPDMVLPEWLNDYQYIDARNQPIDEVVNSIRLATNNPQHS